MTALIHAELLKLRSLRSTYVAMIALLVLAAAIVAAALSEAGSEGMRTAAELQEPVVVAGGFLAALFLAVLGVNGSAGEYRHATIAQRFLATPTRHRVLAAKLLTYAGLGGSVAVVTLAVALAMAQPLIDAKDLSLGLSPGDAAAMAAAAFAATAMFGMLGVAIGFLCRSQSAGVTIVFGTLIAEKLFGGFLGPVAALMPFELMQTLLGVHGRHRVVSGVGLAGVTAAVILAVTYVVRQRDVT